ncbi:MAG TPA: hypothetical protein VK589_14825 [Chryseolinea sp.]|nr:hypothetical protein [Chryseolinea sp.]
MRYVADFILSTVFSHKSLAQLTDHIGNFISDALHIARVESTNPVIYDNDWVIDTPEDRYVRLKPTIIR